MNRILFLLCLIALCFSSASADAVHKHFDFKASPAAAPQQTTTAPVVVQPPRLSGSNTFLTRTAAWQKLVDLQKILREKITAQVEELRDGHWASIRLFLLICLLYGMLHALGPGHGKTIVAGYFLARRGRWRQGVALGSTITLVHTFSAVALLFILYGIAKATVFPVFELSRAGIEKASYVLIIITGILLIAISLRGFLKKPEKEQAANVDASWKELLWVALITGSVPCPAVALIVFFCLLNGLPGMALLGALVIGIGMAVTNISFGLAAILLRKGLDRGLGKMDRMGRLAGYANYILSLVGGLLIATMGALLYWSVR